MRLYRAINGGGVRQGTLYPPTSTQREQLERIRENAGANDGFRYTNKSHVHLGFNVEK